VWAALNLDKRRATGDGTVTGQIRSETLREEKRRDDDICDNGLKF